mmetsp:Transcript_99938/g.214025  ORF Transcript_99938/g.214025 Transcript_99938/m.214025 type:complete len:287 (-) Transcript_99938:93-953(-)
MKHHILVLNDVWMLARNEAMVPFLHSEMRPPDAHHLDNNLPVVASPLGLEHEAILAIAKPLCGVEVHLCVDGQHSVLRHCAPKVVGGIHLLLVCVLDLFQRPLLDPQLRLQVPEPPSQGLLRALLRGPRPTSLLGDALAAIKPNSELVDVYIAVPVHVRRCYQLIKFCIAELTLGECLEGSPKLIARKHAIIVRVVLREQLINAVAWIHLRLDLLSARQGFAAGADAAQLFDACSLQLREARLAGQCKLPDGLNLARGQKLGYSSCHLAMGVLSLWKQRRQGLQRG